MKRTPSRSVLALLVAWLQTGVSAAAEDAFSLFDEARVVTASFHPSSAAQAPATVRVVTSEEIEASGAQTLWDALRTVPGVEVAQTAAFGAEVGIRGLNGPLNNRLLVLLDGRTVMNANFDFIVWEAIPVTLEEIERIEVVEGPALALFGANAVAGVVNIITKTPERMGGGRVGFSAGEAGFRSGSAMYGARRGRLDYKVSSGARYGGRFERADAQGADTRKLHALVGYEPDSRTRLAFSAGFAKADIKTSAGALGTTVVEGNAGFLMADIRSGQTDLRAFWNRERSAAAQFQALGNPPIDYDTIDMTLKRAWVMPFDNRFVLGGGIRNNVVQSKLLEGGRSEHDLWSAFFEDEWRPFDSWTLIAGGRVDKHPLTPPSFSPRGSLIYTHSTAHVFRASAGTSFRNPTLLEGSGRITQVSANAPGGALANPPFTDLSVLISGSRNLVPERMFQTEVAHAGSFGPVRTTLTGFYYELTHLISATTPAVVAAVPPVANLSSTFRNRGGVRAVGVEAGLETSPRPGLTLFGNYAYQRLRDDIPEEQEEARAAPSHKVNAGARLRRGGLTAGVSGDWVGKTLRNRSAFGRGLAFAEVPDYLLLNARVGYEFSGRWEGWEAGVAAFNLAGRAHQEMLSATAAGPGQSAETIRSRWTATVSYRFR